MHELDRIDGVKIVIHNGDHRPPHLHAIYNEFEVTLMIETSEPLGGHIPVNQLKKVAEWLAENRTWALSVFFELNPNLRKKTK